MGGCARPRKGIQHKGVLVGGHRQNPLDQARWFGSVEGDPTVEDCPDLLFGFISVPGNLIGPEVRRQCSADTVQIGLATHSALAALREIETRPLAPLIHSLGIGSGFLEGLREHQCLHTRLHVVCTNAANRGACFSIINVAELVVRPTIEDAEHLVLLVAPTVSGSRVNQLTCERVLDGVDHALVGSRPWSKWIIRSPGS